MLFLAPTAAKNAFAPVLVDPECCIIFTRVASVHRLVGLIDLLGSGSVKVDSDESLFDEARRKLRLDGWSH
jgi:hypothetical protein